MSLGVLNNLSAVYAENNLNNTNNSLSKTLQQLSSGSKINSGADDAAGLSLVDGLQANQTALMQSETNATEGTGLLQVADGALSQVTSLLNRAVTLATEASNGTLNSSQDTAANQEYQSILSEISNIGSTTTYNNQAVFGTSSNIYTGDSSTTGASIDDLNIRSLSSANVGDSSGVMSYATAGSNGSVFLSLGNTTATLASTTYAAGGAVATAGSITVDALSSAGGTVSQTITAGGTTVGAMIAAINNSGLGITASLATDKVAGAGVTGDVGIMITGSVGVGAAPSNSSYSGSVTAGAAGDTLSGSVSITEGSGASQTISMAAVNKAEGASTMTALEAYIASDGALGVAETGTATAAMGLASAGSATTKLQVNSNLYDVTTGASLNYTANNAYNVGVNSATTAITAVATTGVSATATAGSAGSSGGTATIGYSDAAGQALNTTDLNNQTDAQAALTELNTAITDVAAQDGYIGAQINTLNSVSQVLSTQQENVQSAQNAVQATDYASASSNMSKYEILSQTGISALAQANSVQQEVTKLLQ